MTDEDITNIRNIKNEDPGRIRIIAASTPSGKRESYYKWCVYASRSFLADVKHIEQTGKVRYIRKRAKGIKPNGWTQYYAPSTVNKNLQKVNPDTGQTYLQDLKDEFPEYRYEQEVMAEFGEELAGVYQKRFIDHAVDLGIENNATYANMQPRPVKGPRIMGVDWDKCGAETSLLAYEWDADKKVFMPLDKVAIPRNKFTLTMAVETIIKMDSVHNFDWIFVDRGFGEMQIEQLHLYGKGHPSTGLHKKVIGVSFSEKVPVRDPYTRKKDNKEVKPFMVNQSVNLFEKGMIALVPRDMQLKEQLEQYAVKGVSPTGRPTYTDENEHFIDALNLIVLGFALKYDALIRVQLAKRTAPITSLDKAVSDSAMTTASGLTLDDAKRSEGLGAANKKESKYDQSTKATKLVSFGTQSRGRTGRVGPNTRTTF